MGHIESQSLRVLMLVDNGIVGDSRVQKSAKAVADAGHEVHLVGLCVNGVPDSKPEIPGVTVHQVATNAGFNQRKLSSIPKNPVYMLGYWDREATARAQRRNAYRLASLPVIRNSSATLGKVAKVVYKVAFSIHQFRLFIHRFALRHGSRNQTSVLGKVRGRITLIVRSRTAWKSLSPILKDLELSADGIIAKINPDVLHAHDFRALGPGVRSVLRRASKKKVVIVYDAHEYLPGLESNPYVAQLGYVLSEKQYIKKADHVITVSEMIAELLLSQHELKAKPTVVLNAPSVNSQNASSVRVLRDDCGVGTDVPLGVYLGGVAPHRGLNAVVDGLSEVPNIHIALVSNQSRHTNDLLDRALDLGCADRVHILPYVEPSHVVKYIANADFGIAPYLHLMNQEVSLPSKFYEYACAAVPILGSDVAVVKQVITELGIGRVFIAGKSSSFAAELRRLLEDLDEHKKAFEKLDQSQFTWEAQAETLRNVYAQISHEFHGAS